jgi:glycosyltransferase involved in cell wall biosynthesis
VRVSVIIPVYNSERTIGNAIRTALAQDFAAYEVIVIDDGSTDSTPEIIMSFDSRVRYIRQDNRGPAAARNAGARVSRGEYLAFLDADDEWLPSKLERMVTALDDNPNAVLAFSNFIGIDSAGGEFRRLYASNISIGDSNFGLDDDVPLILPSCVVIRREIFEACGGFCEDFKRPGGEDPFLWLLAWERGKFVYVAEALVRYSLPSLTFAVGKYEQGRQLLIGKLRERYGRKARPIVTRLNRESAARLLTFALHQLDTGRPFSAIASSCRALRIGPGHLLDPAIALRLFRTRNIRRLINLLRFSLKSGRRRTLRKSFSP